MAWKTCILLTAFAAVSLAQYLPTPQPSYGGPNAVINVDNSAARNTIEAESGLPNAVHQEEYYEWEGYDGWYNNPAHPEWGGAGEFTDRGGNADRNRYIVTTISLLSA